MFSAMKTTPLHLQLTAVFEPAKEGGYLASFAELPEVFSEGDTLEQARANLFDALYLVLEYHRDQAGTEREDASAVIRETFQLASAQ